MPECYHARMNSYHADVAADLWTLVELAAQQWPDDPMLVSRQGDRCTFAEFRTRASQTAAGLADLGVSRRDVVSWILPTWVDTVVLAAALSRLGAVQNPIIAIYRDREVGFCTAQAAATHLITPRQFGGFDFGAMGERISAQNPTVNHLAVEPGSFPIGNATGLSPFVAPADRETGWICYTSGTSADPKGARHSDATIGSFVAAMGSCMSVCLLYTSPSPRDS